MTNADKPLISKSRMFDYTKIPVPYMAESVKLYLEKGILPGDFLTAVITNDLFDACQKADNINRHYIFKWCCWFVNEAPATSWGSLDIVKAWVKAHAAKR